VINIGKAKRTKFGIVMGSLAAINPSHLNDAFSIYRNSAIVNYYTVF